MSNDIEERTRPLRTGAGAGTSSRNPKGATVARGRGRRAKESPRSTPRLREPVRSTVEPLLLERRRQVRQQDRQRRTRRLKALGVVVLVIALVVGLLFSPLFDIDHFVVTGDSRVDAERIVRESGLKRGSALIAVDLPAARAALEADPWIAHAELQRHYPGTVTIRVAEEIPALVLVGERGSALVSRNGRILEFAEGAAGGDGRWSGYGPVLLARYDGRIARDSPSADALPGRHVSDQVLDLVRLSRNVSPLVEQHLDRVEMGPRGDLDLVLRDGSVVLLGPPDHLSAKLVAVAAVLGQVDLECLARIDVRNPTRATVLRRSDCAGAAVPGAAGKGN